NAPTPYRCDQLVLADHADTIAYEVQQQVKYLWFYSDLTCASSQFVSLDIERVVLKAVDHHDPGPSCALGEQKSAKSKGKAKASARTYPRARSRNRALDRVEPDMLLLANGGIHEALSSSFPANRRRRSDGSLRFAVAARPSLSGAPGASHRWLRARRRDR